ncbi:MAG TPA: LuxR C-terminal-related transcriptional regulator, partial [Pseudonocardiaceae bacterium]|nr:LuxR C-terminal-related transcriptional regulator [Pseudonocardiaceae bacterium]
AGLVTLTGVERVLLETKLHPPAPRRLVPRPSLVERLSPTDRRLTVLDAPAGWGKTCLVGQWVAATNARVAWLGLDRGDDDPVLFWTYVIAALRTQLPGTGDAALAAMGAGWRALREAAIPLLLNDLLAQPDPIVLILDDYHVISNPQVHATLALLLERMPPALHLVVCSRGETPLPVGRLRAEGELLELRAEELALDNSEVARALDGIPGVALSEADVDRLRRRTEGWAAGVSLARASLAARPAAAASFVEAFTGTDRYVLEYLGNEVLTGLPEDQRTFLLHTSILRKLSPPLCAVVTGRSDAAAMLDRLERAGLFVTAIDSARQWFHYHRLFGELLHHELTLAAPTLVPELHRRAAAWWLDYGDLAEAVEHQIASGNSDHAADTVAAHWNEWFNRGLLGTVSGWLDRLPAARIRADHRLCAARAWLMLDHGDLESAGPWIAAVETAVDPHDTAALRDLAVLRSVHRFKIGDLGASRTAAHRVLELDGDEVGFAATVAYLISGITAHWSGHREVARRPLAQAVRLARRTANALAETYALGYLALNTIDAGALDDAARAVPVALEASANPAVAEHFVAALPHLARAYLMAASGQPHPAADAAARALALARRGAGRLEVAITLGMRAQTAATLGSDGQQWLNQARSLARSCPDPGVVPTRLSRVRIPDHSPHPLPTDTPAPLSARERELLPLLAGSLSQREIGAALHLSLNTVKSHTRVLFRKLGVSSRAEAIARARELGLL